MTKLKPAYGKEEFARRGHLIYERDILPKLGVATFGQIAAIDIDSGNFAVHADTLSAVKDLRFRVPRAQIWCVRVGHPAVERIM